jgi:hypothetical protein
MRIFALAIAALAASVRLSATTSSAAVDIRDFHGQAKLVLNASATEAADNTADVKLQHCDTAGGAYTDAGVAFAQVTNASASFQVVDLNVDRLKRYVKVVSTLAGTAPKVTLGVEIIGQKQNG